MGLALQSIADKLVRGGALKVGFLAGATYPVAIASGGKKAKPALPVAQVAFWNEFGTSRAPARPFFRTTIAKESAAWGDKLSKALVYYNYDGALALRALGQSMRDDLEATIQRWDSPRNADSTIARKGFNKPLIHNSIMVRAPDFELVE